MSSSSLAFNILIFSEISWQKSYRDCLQHYLRFSFHLEMLFISWNIIFTDPICVMDLLHGMNIPYMILFYQSQVQDDCLPSCHFLSIRNSRLLRDTFSSWPYGKIFIIILLWVCYRWINLIQTWFEYSFGDFLYVFVKTRWPPPLDKGFTMDHNNRKMNKCCFFFIRYQYNDWTLISYNQLMIPYNVLGYTLYVNQKSEVVDQHKTVTLS